LQVISGGRNYSFVGSCVYKQYFTQWKIGNLKFRENSDFMKQGVLAHKQFFTVHCHTTLTRELMGRQVATVHWNGHIFPGANMNKELVLGFKEIKHKGFAVHGKVLPGGVTLWKRRYGNYYSGWADSNILWVIIALNVAVYLLWQVLSTTPGGRKLMVENFMISLNNLKSGRIWTILTATFSHYELLHLLFNMFTLYFIGRQILQVIGPARFLNLYVVGGLCSTVASECIDLIKMKYAHSFQEKTVAVYNSSLGASGSVMSVLVLFGLLFPNTTLYVNFVLPVPAVVLVSLYILLDLYGLEQGGGKTNNMAHLAGAAYGLLYFWINMKGGRIRRNF